MSKVRVTWQKFNDWRIIWAELASTKIARQVGTWQANRINQMNDRAGVNSQNSKSQTKFSSKTCRSNGNGEVTMVWRILSKKTRREIISTKWEPHKMYLLCCNRLELFLLLQCEFSFFLELAVVDGTMNISSFSPVGYLIRCCNYILLKHPFLIRWI